jgi:hypothetical protein
MGAQPARSAPPLAGEDQRPAENRLAAGELNALLTADLGWDLGHERASREVALPPGGNGAGSEGARERASEDYAQIHTGKAGTSNRG